MNKEKEHKEYFEIQFKADRKDIFINSSGCEIERDDYVIVEADKGEDIGYVSQKGHLAKLKQGKETTQKILRPATEEDVEKIDKRTIKEKEALETCKKKVVEHNLQMKIVDVEIQFDNSKISFFFTADQRVDFRELVKELASIYRTRIELRQIGVRDEARRLGGFGICGLKQCCNSFIKEFEQITTHMARDQQLLLNPTKISGNCGRLLCCLKYELEYYQETNKICPSQGQIVEFGEENKKKGIVIHTDILKKILSIKTESGEIIQQPCSECLVVDNISKKPKDNKQGKK